MREEVVFKLNPPGSIRQEIERLMAEGVRQTCVGYYRRGEKTLLLYRNVKPADRDMNHGKWIGIGGHLERGESPREAMFREFQEEMGIPLLEAEYGGGILYRTTDGDQEVMHVFRLFAIGGEPTTSTEGTLGWLTWEEFLAAPHWESDEPFLQKLIQEDRPCGDWSFLYDGKLLLQVETEREEA